jgi:putative peptidoglycan lipid II flippase
MNKDQVGKAQDQLLKRSTTVSFFTGLGVIAGFAVDVLFVARFGIGAETDAFFAAYTVPFILLTRLTALQPVFIPVLTGHRDDETAFSALLNASTLLALAVAALGALLARPLIAVTAPGFAPANADLAARLAAILFFRVPATAVAELCRGELYARQRFGLATFSSALPSLVTATLLVLMGSSSGIEAIAWSYVLGALAQAVLLAGLLFGPLGAPYRLALRHPAPIVRQTGRLVLAPLVGLFLRQGVTLAERILGSYLPAGSVTALSYANRLNSIVAGVFFEGIATASLPTLSQRWQNAKQAARAELTAVLKLMVTVAIPVGLTVAALSTPLVRLFFERGQVSRESALLLASVLGIYSLSLPFLGPFRAVQTYFYSIKDTRPIVILQGSLAALAVALDLILVWNLGALGLALGYALSCGLTTAFAIAWLVRRTADPSSPSGTGLDWWRLADSTWRLGLASGAMAITLFGISHWMEIAIVEAGRWELLVALGVSGLAGLAVFATLGTLLHVEAMAAVWHLARKQPSSQ